MKQAGQKLFGMVPWANHMAAIRPGGRRIRSVADTVGRNLLGHTNPLEFTMDEMIVATKAVRHGVKRVLLLQGMDFALASTVCRLTVCCLKEAGADINRLDGVAEYPEAVTAMTRAGIPVWAQFGLTPQRALASGISYESQAGGAVCRTDGGEGAARGLNGGHHDALSECANYIRVGRQIKVKPERY